MKEIDECRVPNAECRVPNAECRVTAPQSRNSTLGIRHSAFVLWIFLLPLTKALSQPIDERVTDFDRLATFDEAAALAVDPSGVIYVVDRGSNSIKILKSTGSVDRELGGPGAGEGQFYGPADIDPTNGLVLVVADAGNGRIQRFSSEFLFLESLPVNGISEASQGRRPHYRQREQDLIEGSGGQPIAVRTSQNNTMYAIDAAENVVLKWDVDRNLEYAIGAYDQGQGALLEPAAIALEATALYVADRGHEAIFVYDAFGGFDRSMAEGLCGDARALELVDEWLVLALSDRLLWYQKRGRLERVISLDLPEDIVDIAFWGNALYVLGVKTLYRTVLDLIN